MAKQVIYIFSALLSSVIAIPVGFIAYQQWKLNVDKYKRESNSTKLHINIVVKRFLRSVDINRVVDDKLYEELQEALALTDSYSEGIVTDWLFQVDPDTSAWLNLM